MNDVLLEARGIVKEFPGVKALDDVQFELRKNEVHCLLGENGAGKSTMMKIFAGIYKATSGEILLRGEPVIFENTKEAQAVGIGIIHQELNLCKHLTVAQNIFLGREKVTSCGVVNEAEMNRMAKEVLDSFHEGIDPKSKISELSISKQQIVEIAKSLSQNAEIIIMDEPTSSLSGREVEELFNIIHKLREDGKGIIYISHKLDELKEISDRVTVFRDGKYIETVDFENTTVDNLVTMMVGRSIEDKFPYVAPNNSRHKLLEIKDLTVEGLIKDVSFDIFGGEALGIFGLVGAGRTEVAKTIFGAIKKSSGDIIMYGRSLNITSERMAIKEGIVYAPEDRKKEGLAVKMTVAENLVLPTLADISSAFGVISKKRQSARSLKKVDELRIKTPSIEQIVNNLSGGNQQKIVIGKWLMHDPKVIIFDEPTRGIDVNAKVEFYKIFNALKLKGVGVVIISSELPEILGLTDRILVMAGGKSRAILNTRDESTTQEKIMHYATM